jgi:hypothetical protein
MLGDVWCSSEPKPFEGRSWQKQVTAKLKTVFVLWLPLCLLLKFINTQCQLGCSAFVRCRT